MSSRKTLPIPVIIFSIASASDSTPYRQLALSFQDADHVNITFPQLLPPKAFLFRNRLS
jgi:hypothetical protein